MRRRRRTPVVALSALAAGSDTLFAEAAVGLNARAFRPRRYADEFATARAARSARWFGSDRPRSQEAYRGAMRWVAERSNVLLAVWDGRPAAASGTADTVAHAVALGRSVLHLDLARRRVVVHGG